MYGKWENLFEEKARHEHIKLQTEKAMIDGVKASREKQQEINFNELYNQIDDSRMTVVLNKDYFDAKLKLFNELPENMRTPRILNNLMHMKDMQDKLFDEHKQSRVKDDRDDEMR